MSAQPSSQTESVLVHRSGPGVRLRLLASCFILYAFYANFGLWSDNEQIRYALAKAIVEDRSFQVDRFRRHLGLDKALYGGHIYCDKPPGSSFLIAPQYLLARGVVSREHFRRDATHDWTEPVRVWVVVCLSVCLYAAVSVALLYEVLGRLGMERGRMGCCYAYAAGTLAFPYATALVGEQFVAPLVIAAIWFALRGERRPDLFWLGFFVGLVFVTQYHAVLIVGWLIPLKWVTMQSRRQIGWALAPAFVWVLLLMWYNSVCFGGPFNLSYSYWQGGQIDFRLALPSLWHLHLATFSSWKGVFYYSPWLLFYFVGVAYLWRARRVWATYLGLATLSYVGFLLLNSNPDGHYWWGGADFGGRQFVPVTPVLAVGAALGIERLMAKVRSAMARRVAWAVVVCVVGWGVFACSIGAMTSPVTYELTQEDGAYYVQRHPHEPKQKLEGVTDPLLDTTLKGLLTFGSNNLVTQLWHLVGVSRRPGAGWLAANLATNAIPLALAALMWLGVAGSRRRPGAESPASDAAREWWPGAARLGLSLLAAYLLFRFWVFVAQSTTVVSYPFEVCAGEGILLNQGRLLAQGDSIYGPIGDYPFLISHFPPVLPVLLALGVKLFGIAFWPGRAISFLSSMAAALSIYWLASDGHRRRVAGLVGALLFFTSSWLWLAAVELGGDSLALGLSLAAVALVSHRQSAGRAAAAGVLFALAVLTRQTQVAGLAAVCWWLWSVDRRCGWAILGWWLAVVALIVVAAEVATGGWFHEHVVTHTAGQVSLERLWFFAGNYSRVHLALLGLAAVFAWQQWRRREMGLLGRYLVTAYLLTCTCARQGSGQTYFIEAIAATGAAAGVVIGRLWAESRRRPWAFSVVVVLTVAVLEVARLQTGTAATPTVTQRRETTVLLEKLKRLGPPILSEYNGLVLQAGGELLFQPYAFAMLAAKRGWDDRRLAEDLRGQKFRAVVVDCVPRGRWTTNVYGALEVAYGVEGEYWLYRHIGQTRVQLLVPHRMALPTATTTIPPSVTRPKNTPKPNDLGLYKN